MDDPKALEGALLDIVQSYFESDPDRMVRHQIDTFDDFVSNKIEQIVSGFNPIEIPFSYNPEEDIFNYKIYIHMKNLVITPPTIHEKDGSMSMLSPNVARNRNFTYAANMYVDIHFHVTWFEKGKMNESSKIICGVNMGKLPIMVNSKYCVTRDMNVQVHEKSCRYDRGGYFIVNGNEKVIVSQDRIAENKVYVFLDTKLTTNVYVCEIRSVLDNTFSTPKLTSMKTSSKQNLYGTYIRASIHYIKSDIPLFVIMRAFGIETDKHIIDMILSHVKDTSIHEKITSMLQACAYDAVDVKTSVQAYEWLMSNVSMTGSPKEIASKQDIKMAMVRRVLTKDVLPHVGNNHTKKAYFLARMAAKLMMCAVGAAPRNDRDTYINKRVDSPGVLIATLFRQYYGKIIKDMKSMVYKEFSTGTWKTTNNPLNIINMNNLYKIIKFTTIETGIKYALATGNWGVKNMNTKQGVAQVLNRMTYNATLSHMRRINTPMEKSGKLIQPRKLHATQWGMICPSETPEGGAVGLVKNMSVSTSITIASNSAGVRRLLEACDVIPFDERDISASCAKFARYTHVFVNGDLVGHHTEPHVIVQAVKRARRTGQIHIHTSVSWNTLVDEVHVCTEAGRCVRPLVVVDPGTHTNMSQEIVEGIRSKQLSWNDLLCPVISNAPCLAHLADQGTSVVEFVDVEEMNTSMIAMFPKDLFKGSKGDRLPVQHTNVEIHPSLILGVMANNIPFPDHNQAPRVTYQSAMGKQAIGVHVTNYKDRMDTMSHVLNYPQRPLVTTYIAQHLNSHVMASGVNAIVAIATYTGYNQEDSVMINRGALERGLFNSTFYRTYKDHCNKNHSTGEEELFCDPVGMQAKRIKPFNYSKIDETGFAPVNTFVDNGDIIVGKCMPQKQGDTFVYNDNSTVLKNNETGFVDKVCAHNKHCTNINSDGYVFSKVRLRNMRMPVIGDKVSSRHGQKGTIGMVYDQCDMPFTKDGIVPDIIMNPHAVPSRMTIGQLIECIMGKSCATLGTIGNATPFKELDIRDICAILESCGMESCGNEIMYNPRTGEQMRTLIFMGPTYYQRLKHMVQDKVHSRSSSGPIVLMTRQPSEGRARDGGLRLGEMEVECNWAHGCMSFLKERTMECSDNYRLFVCRRCKIPANVNPDAKLYKCFTCGNTTAFSEIRIPYTCKLMLQEIQSMGIATRIDT